MDELLNIGFVFTAGKTPNHYYKTSNGGDNQKIWNERFQELVAYKEEHGHTLVAQKSGPLWVYG
jgi:hypothetical protein